MRRLLPILALLPLASCQSFVRSVESWTPEDRATPVAVTQLVVLPPQVSVGDRTADGTFLPDNLRTEQASRLLQHRLDRALAAHGGLDVLPTPSLSETERLAIARCVDCYVDEMGLHRLPREDVEFGDALAFLSREGDELVLLPVALQWTPTAGRETWGWVTGAFMAHAPTGATQIELLLIDPRSGQLEWAGAYLQGATAGWKTAALTDEEDVEEILEDLLAELPAPADAQS